MKCVGRTEEELMDEKAPWPETEDQLIEYLRSLAEIEHSYGSCPAAMSLAATATFNYMSMLFGATGFQSGYATMDFIRRTKGIEGPFIITKAENELYPQFNNRADLDKFLESHDVQQWLVDKAKENLKKNEGTEVHPNVLGRWEEYASKEVL